MASHMPSGEVKAGLAVVDSLITAGNPQDAVNLARELSDRFASDPLYGWQVKGRLGLALIRSGHAEESLAPLEAAIRERPQDPVLHRDLAYALKALGRNGRALAEYQSVVLLDPADPRGHLEYGQTLLDFRDFKGAERELKLAAGLCDRCLEAERALANLYGKSQDPGRAVTHLARVWEVDRSDQVRRLYTRALAAAGQGTQALALWDSVSPGRLQAQEWRMLVQIEKDNPQLGVSWSAATLAPGVGGSGPAWTLPPDLNADGAFWAVVAANLQRSGQPAGALAALDRALALQPKNVVYRRNRVSVLLDLGRDAEARRAWEEVLRLDPGQQANPEKSP